MGNPIANDPCYGGELFYNDAERREKAIEVLRGMRRDGKHPLSKVPHLGVPELDNPTHFLNIPIQLDSAPIAATAPASDAAHFPDSSFGSKAAEHDSVEAIVIESSEEEEEEEEAAAIAIAIAPAIMPGVSIVSVADISGSGPIDLKDDIARLVQPDKIDIEEQGETETDQEYLVRTCRYT